MSTDVERLFCEQVHHTLFSELSVRQQQMVLALMAIEQTHVLDHAGDLPDAKERIEALLDQLSDVDEFYAPIGGLIGYHRLVEELLETNHTADSAKYTPPEGFDLTRHSKESNQAILHAIKHWEDFAEVYPVGGAADRLKLQDDISHEHLPAAKLSFAGKPLLAGMMRDLEAREYLHYKLFGKQLTTPVVMMTSLEKDNAEHIRSICEENNWFGRPRHLFCLITQPLVPTFDEEGNWCTKEPLKLLLKPGGHGAIWHLMELTKTFDWLKKQKRTCIFLRQINNPVASIDGGALGFLGLGHRKGRKFGFASCHRLSQTHEGVNVLKTTPDQKQCLTSIEYCAFKRHGIEDKPCQNGYSQFPSNTNILFADLKDAQQAAIKQPFPGALLNFRPLNGKNIARIETMMQNLADTFTSDQTYITFNERHKTISTTKRKFENSDSWVETPEGCFYDLLKNAHELLTTCNFTLPTLSESEFFQDGPPFIFLYHPALGPLYSIIAQKLRYGTLHPHSELILEIADADISHLNLSGSLIIETKVITGHLENHLNTFSNQTGRIHLENVTVINKGYDRTPGQPFWKHAMQRQEALRINLSRNSEFIARDMTFDGNQTINVPENTRIIATADGLKSEAINGSKPFWTYSTDSASNINLSRT